jgi:hypothetical protein
MLMARNQNGGLGAPRRFLEADLEVVPQIRPALGPAAAAAAEAETEHVAEDVAKVAELGEHARIESGARARRGADAGMAEPVVQAALLGIGEHGVRFSRGFELFFGLRIARIAIRMMLHRQLAIALLISTSVADLETPSTS